MLINFEEHGFRVTARKLPESCTSCPFWGVDLKNLEDGICYLTGHTIKTDGPQDTQRMDDCIIEQIKSTTKNDFAQERYQDLIEYFGDEKVAKTILESRKEFKAWLERLRWNVKRADELARELEQMKATAKNDLGVTSELENNSITLERKFGELKVRR